MQSWRAREPEYLPVILAMLASGLGPLELDDVAGHRGDRQRPDSRRDRHELRRGRDEPLQPGERGDRPRVRLASQNLQGGSVPHESYMGSQGNLLNYNAVIVENEAASPWQPFHVQHGREADDSTVSLLLGGWYTLFGGGPRETWQELFTRSLLACDPFTGPVIALDPLVARGFVELGFDTKEKLIDWCVEHARLPARQYWDNQWIQTSHHPRAVAGIEPYASRLKAAPDELVRMFRPEDIHVVVVGGETGATWKMMGGGPRLNIVDIDPWR